MIAGHDYLSLRLKIGSFWNKTRVSAASLLITGGILIGVGSAYYGYADDARANLSQYQATAVEIASAWSPPPVEETVELTPFSQAFLPEQSLYSGDAGVEPASVGSRLPEGFVLIDSSSRGNLPETAPAKWMSIGALDINSIVEELSVVEIGDRRAYETPNNTVGHIPETADAGEPGEGWYFGHTESPVLDEGSVFFRLQEIPELLRRGENIDIITDNGTDQFLYRVTQTRVVHEDDLALENGGGTEIHLVSCVPRLVYDHRLIVDAQLIGRKLTS